MQQRHNLYSSSPDRGDCDCHAPSSEPATALSAQEIADLLHMVEEEKLAGDVYETLYEKTGIQNFGNIVQAERRHQSAVQSLLKRYGIADPTLGKGLGVFENSEFADLYQVLITQGQQSIADALKVGAKIEDLDIADLNHLLANCQRSDFVRVYENLNRGSRNHLRSFDRALKTHTQEYYTPEHISQAQYDAIVSAPHEQGRGCQEHGQQRRRGQGRGRGEHSIC